MIAVPVSWQKGSTPLHAVSALRRNCSATYLSFSEASGSVRILATCSLCSLRSMNSTSWNACWASCVRASFETLRIVFPSNSPVVTPSLVSRRYSVLSSPNWNIGAYLNSGMFAILIYCFTNLTFALSLTIPTWLHRHPNFRLPSYRRRSLRRQRSLRRVVLLRASTR